MPKGVSVSKRKLAVATMLAGFLGVAVLTGCFDARRAIAFRTLVGERQGFDAQAYGGAIKARFPTGTPVQELRDYAAESKGTCWNRKEGGVRCEIPLRGGLCWAELAAITATVDASLIGEISVEIGSLGC